MSTSKLFIIVLLSAIMGGTVAVLGLNFLVLEKVFSSPNEQVKNAQQTSSQGVISNNQNQNPQNTGTAVSSSQYSFNSDASDRAEEIVEAIYEKLSPAVVHITTVKYTYNFFRGELVPQEGTGSGVLIDNEGHILTNHHVVEPAISTRGEIYVTFANGESEKAYVIGTDEISDIAVIKLTEKPNEKFPIPTLGNSDALKVGARAIAIGNPFGLSGTCTVGVISALNRTIYVRNQELEGMIQTDATINPGNSGGPLINSKGEIIGITSAIFSQSGGSEGIGFAIPINIAKRIMSDLITYHKVRRPYLGIATFPVVAPLARLLELPVTEGLMIQQVEYNSPAYKAGLKGGTQAIAYNQFKIYVNGDIITHLNGEKVKYPTELDKAIRKMEIGDKIILDIIRNEKPMKVEIILGTQP